jgi:hypothetical protein
MYISLAMSPTFIITYSPRTQTSLSSACSIVKPSFTNPQNCRTIVARPWRVAPAATWNPRRRRLATRPCLRPCWQQAAGLERTRRWRCRCRLWQWGLETRRRRHQQLLPAQGPTTSASSASAGSPRRRRSAAT